MLIHRDCIGIRRCREKETIPAITPASECAPSRIATARISKTLPRAKREIQRNEKNCARLKYLPIK